MLPLLVITALIAYLLGSLPFGYLVARSRGVNIFEVGSKNPGATNVRRVLGSGPGNLVFALDALKGAIAVALPIGYFALFHRSFLLMTTDRSGQVVGAIDLREIAEIVAMIFALLGHSFSCFTRFRGGKGVATAAGGFAVLFPAGISIALGVWGLAAWLSRFVSLASILAAVSLPASALLLRQSSVLVSASSLVAIIVILRHRSNIARIAAGTESRIGQKKATPSP
jgi:glycerol-3-phosphate acyltransferase PlsY